MDKKKNAPEKIYRPALLSRFLHAIIFLFVGSLFAIALIGFLSGLAQVLSAGIISIMLSLFFLYVLFSMTWYCAEYMLNFAIVVTPDGIWLHGYGKRFYTWDALIELDKPKWTSDWGIKTTPANIEYKSRFGKWFLSSGLYKNFIPLELIVKVPRKWLFFRDIEKFKETELGQVLAQNAPHLFDGDNDWKPKHQLEDAYEDEDQPDWLADVSSKQKARK